MSDPHILLRPPGTFLCRRCGEAYEMNLPVPVDVMVGAMESFNKTHKKCEVSSRGLACHYCYKFGHAPEQCLRLEYDGDWRKWLNGPDTGASSETLCRALAHGPEVLHQSISTPRDVDDFGRCYRLLKAIQSWRKRIGDVRHLAGWSPLVDAWDELERLYEHAMTSGEFEPFNERMRTIDEAQGKQVKPRR
jgi:hypothetical protein